LKYSLITVFFCFVIDSLINWAYAANRTTTQQVDTRNPPILKYDPTGSNSWYPYYIPEGRRKGIVAEIATLVLKEAQIHGEKVQLPPKRTNLSIENGVIDFDFINPEWLPSEISTENFTFSDSIIPIKEYVITLPSAKSDNKDANSIVIKNQLVGTVRGYYYHDEAQFQRMDYSSEKELIKALATNRVKFAISGDLPALYWSKQLNVPIQFGALHSDGFLHIRLHNRANYLMPKINQAIRRLKSSGTIQEVIDSYLLVNEITN